MKLLCILFCTVHCSNMLLITALLLLRSFDLLHAETRACTNEDFCMPVPAGTCDKSLCQTFNLDDLASFGANGVRVFTYIFGQTPYVRYCPLYFHLEEQESYDGVVSMNLPISLNSGPYCNISTITTRSISFKPDPYTGMLTEFTFHEAGESYVACMIYFKSGEAYVHRVCRVDEHGEECATIYAVEAANGNCNRDDLKNFLQSLGVDFSQKAVDCLPS